MTNTETRSIQVIATVTGAFTLPLMVYLSIGGQTSALQEFILQCVATTMGAAIGFAFFLPKGSFSGTGSLFRRVSGGAAVGLVVGFLTISRLQMGPLDPLTLFGLSFFAALGAFGAWGLTLKDDLIDRRRRGQPVAWPVKVLFGNGVLSVCAWVALGFATCIVYFVVDITQVTSGRKPATANAALFDSALDSSNALHSSMVSKSKLPGLPSAEEFGTYLVDRRINLLSNVKIDTPAADAHRDAPSSVNGSDENVSVMVEETTIQAESAYGPDRFDNATVPELLAVIANKSSQERTAAVMALDRMDPGDTRVRSHRSQIAKAYKALAQDNSLPDLQPTGVWGMVRWGGTFSVPHLIQFLEDDPNVLLAEAVLSALAELNDPRGAVAVAKMAERVEYRDAAIASLQAMGEVTDQIQVDVTSHPSD